jgi:ABC-type dipeptide/oligopeptide/nickel transport system ATPase component
MQLGNIVELLSVGDMRKLRASHPYTSHLLRSNLGRRSEAVEAESLATTETG